ncbi:MAG: hypothetical protein JW901_05160 [Dehalococcoidia bacterium]|nr:hypothetical protein [Dehalococcoidia bacterium]
MANSHRMACLVSLLIAGSLIFSAACGTDEEQGMQQGSSQTTTIKSDIKVNVVPMQSVTPAIYLQMPNLDITFVDFEITNNGDNAVRLSVESELQGYSEKAIDTVDVGPHSTAVVGQTPILKPQAIPLEIANTTLHYRIADSSGAVIQEQTLPVKIYGRDTMLWAMQEGDDWIDTSVFIGAFVTPHAPEIDELARQAAEYHPSNSMEGYQCSQCSDDQWTEYTTAHVKAVYEALQQDYSLKYINSTIAFSNESEAPQRVRLPAESINTKSSNCIDGAVLYASALESMDMHPYIVLTPTHAFLCYEINPDDPDNLGCLETTMTGSASFEDATEMGQQELTEEISSGNIESGKSKVLSVQQLRASGILPMK